MSLVYAAQGGERRLVAKAHRFQIDRSIGAVVVFEDVTELRALERVRRDFVANVSHELKTPLTSIRGYVETLLEGAVHDPENNVRFLQKIDSNVTRLNALVSDLLSLARIENQEGRLVRNQVDLGALIRTSVVGFEEQAKKRELTLETQVPTGCCVVWGEERGLGQVLENLLTNAIKYTQAGGRVLVGLDRTKDGEAHLWVRDTGVGIPKADQDRIFERFYRVDKARSQDLGGTGLGLSIVKHQVQAMQGRVGVESKEGAGSTFHVWLECAAGTSGKA
ncbi:MAG: ATP-binding protein [Planctomycetota bacterium]